MKTETQRSRVTKQDRKKYVFAEKRDYTILAFCRKLRSKHLTSDDKRLVAIIQTQLIDDWRVPLIKTLRTLQRKYSSTKYI